MKVSFRFALLTAGLLAGVLLSTMVMAIAVDQATGPVVFTNDSGKWIDCPGMPAGCKMLQLYGDPSKPGEFAVRFKYVANYRIAPHTHAGDEHATVISGGPFHIAVGDTFDANAPSGKHFIPPISPSYPLAFTTSPGPTTGPFSRSTASAPSSAIF